MIINIQDYGVDPGILARKGDKGDQGEPGWLADLLDLSRPGDVPAAFTSSMAGGAPQLLSTASFNIAIGAQGTVARVGEAAVAMRRIRAVLPNELVRVRYIFSRSLDSADPANDGHQLGLICLDNGKNVIGTLVLQTFTALTVSSGRVDYSAVVAAGSGIGIDALLPVGTCYVRAFIQVFGTSQTTDVEFIGIENGLSAAQIDAAVLDAALAQTAVDRTQTGADRKYIDAIFSLLQGQLHAGQLIGPPGQSIGVLATTSLINDLTQPFTAALAADSLRNVLIGILANGGVFLARHNEEMVQPGRVLTNGAQPGYIRDAAGNLVFYVDGNGDGFLSPSADMLAILRQKLWPLPRAIAGITNPFAVRSDSAGLYRFLASIESPPPAGTPLTLEYLRRQDIASTTSMRAAQGGIHYHAWTGNSVSVGSQSSDGGKVANSTPPAVLKNGGFMFNPGNLASGTRGMGTVAYNTVNFKVGSLTDFVPAYEQIQSGTQLGETSITAALAWMCWFRDKAGLPWATYVGRTHGAAGNPIANILPGSTPFINGLAEVTAGATIAGKYGRALVAKWVTYIGGHQDRSGLTATLTAAANSGDTTLTIASTNGCYAGMLAIGSGVPAGTTVTAINTATKVVILSAALTAAMASGAAFTAQANPTGYKASLTALASAYAAQWQPITGQASASILAMCQLDGYCKSAATPAGGQPLSPVIAQAQLDWVRANPAQGRILVPMYVCLHDTVAATPGQNDGDHLDPSKGYGIRGEYESKAKLIEDLSGARWSALGEIMTIVRSGATITLSFFRDTAKTIPWGGLNFDTTTFAATIGTCEAVPDGNYGFRYDAAAISGVALATSAAAAALGLANDQVVITLASATAGNLSYAAYGSGSQRHADAWGNLFDGGDTINGMLATSRIFPGFVLKNPCVIFDNTAVA